MSESDVLQCHGGSAKICPATHPIQSAESETCVLSLYLQSPKVRSICGRTVSTELPATTLERQGSLLLYHLVEPKQLFLRCLKLKGQETVSFVLQGTGLLNDAASCHVTMEGLQLYPELRGESTFPGQNPSLDSPLLPEIASPEELKVRHYRDK
jgi:hypothetical protein